MRKALVCAIGMKSEIGFQAKTSADMQGFSSQHNIGSEQFYLVKKYFNNNKGKSNDLSLIARNTHDIHLTMLNMYFTVS